MTRPVDNKPKTFHRLFDRMDRNDDGAISKKEVGKHLKEAKVPSGLFGAVHSAAKDGFMENLDTNKDERVSWQEFQGAASSLLPADLRGVDGRIAPERAGGVFADFDANKDGNISADELEKGTLERLPENTSFRGTVAEVAARLGLDALDADGDALISAKEFDQAASDAGDLGDV
jgi:Ca2+-binding EF-hand superfamily protein